MSDLDKMMAKLNKEKEEKPEEEETDEDDDLEDLEDEEEEEVKPVKKKKKAVEEVAETKSEPESENLVENEVGVLQNNGVYRREYLVAIQEQNTILKAIAEILLKWQKK